MLEGLEASNRPAELYALFGVVDREFQAAGRCPDLFGGQQYRRGSRPGSVPIIAADPGTTRASRRVGSRVCAGSVVTSLQRRMRASSTAMTTSAMSPLIT